jgi:hypothetical protein
LTNATGVDNLYLKKITNFQDSYQRAKGLYPMNRLSPEWFIRALFLIFLLLCHPSAYSADADPAAVKPDDHHIYLFPKSLNSSVNFGVGLGVSDVLDADERRRIECQKNFCASLALDPYRSDEQAPEVSTVMQLALDRFPFFSGLKETVMRMERTINDYSQRIMLSGEVKVRRLTDNSYEVNENIHLGAQFATQEVTSSHSIEKSRLSIADQLSIRYVRWNSGFNLGDHELSLNLNLGDAIRFTAAGGNHPWLGVMLSIRI